MATAEVVQSVGIQLGKEVVQVFNIPPLDPGLYSLSSEEAAFFKAATGIEDDDALKAHILIAQEKAYKVAPFPCIYGFSFLRVGIAKNPAYNNIVKLGRERQGAIFLDIGCCFSVDARKAASDGFLPSNIVSSDLNPEFLELSHELFNTNKDTYPAHFVAGDAFDPTMLSIVPPFKEVPSSRPDLSNLTSLNPLHGHCSVINASAFFHLFDEEKQLHVARALAGLLSPEPGSVICGIHVGAREKGIVTEWVVGANYSHFRHSPESWAELWDGTVFEKGQVKAEAMLYPYQFLGREVSSIVWSVTRL
ncbi:hypothetical protein HYDPIDRAFT_87780 [Hydnomerulius pinastri MD-312]|nr:hypothetical protein HYDPIDRAFT_87780 [Hydnomerulius pinastri MD-312]